MTNTPTSKLFREAAKKYGQLTEEEREFIAKERQRQEEAQLQAFIKSTNASRIKKAGLLGVYAKANSPLGQEVARRAMDGEGTFLFGRCGRGKTYAAACAVRVFVEKGKTAKLTTTTEFLQTIKDEFDKAGEAQALKRAQGYDLLALDDFGMEKRTEWSMEQLEALLNKRYEAEKPTIITSNYSVAKLRDLWGGVEGDRIASRIAGACYRQEVKGEDWRLQCN